MRYVCGFLFTHDHEQVVLIEKLKPAWQAGKLNGVGGKIEENETALDAMVREFHEETGLLVPGVDWRMFCITSHDGNTIQFFVAFSNGEIRTQETEQVARYYYPTVLTRLVTLPSLVMDNLRWLLPLALSESREFVTCYDPTTAG